VTAAAAKAAAKGGASKGGAKTAASKVFKGGASKRATITAVSAAAPPPQAPEPAPEPPPSKAGRAVVAYNHYKSEFKIDDDGAMAWADIDEEYCISFVFKGEIQVALVTEQGEAIQVAGGKFAGLADGSRYTLQVTEDPEAAAAGRRPSEETCLLPIPDGFV
jgi:hypothetical protein